MNATKKKSLSEIIVNLLKQELVKENFSLNFEHNSQFLKQHPEEVLKYFHSSIVNIFIKNMKYVYLITLTSFFLSGHAPTNLLILFTGLQSQFITQYGLLSQLFVIMNTDRKISSLQTKTKQIYYCYM
jgi:hypothetical protein